MTIYEVRCEECDFYFEDSYFASPQGELCPKCGYAWSLSYKIKSCQSEYWFQRTNGTKTQIKCNKFYAHEGLHGGRVSYDIAWDEKVLDEGFDWPTSL